MDAITIDTPDDESPDPRREIALLEQRIEQLADKLEGCRKFILAARIAMAAMPVVMTVRTAPSVAASMMATTRAAERDRTEDSETDSETNHGDVLSLNTTLGPGCFTTGRRCVKKHCSAEQAPRSR